LWDNIPGEVPVAKSKPKSKRRKVREATTGYGPVEVAASELKNDWHHWLDRVMRGRETVVVTRYGKPVATLAPVPATEAPVPFFGSMRGSVLSYGDLISPTGEIWNAMKDDADPDDPFDLK